MNTHEARISRLAAAHGYDVRRRLDPHTRKGERVPWTTYELIEASTGHLVLGADGDVSLTEIEGWFDAPPPVH